MEDDRCRTPSEGCQFVLKDALALRREITELKCRLQFVRQWIKDDVDFLECRADEDCDHCMLLNATDLRSEGWGDPQTQGDEQT